MSDDEMKKRVLARRAQFIAAAVAGLVACEPGPDAQPPNVCLSISVPPPEDGAAGPTVVDAGVSADPDAAWSGADATAGAQDSEAPPMPCLSPPPTPCLSVALPPPPDAGPPPRPCLKPVPPPRTPPTSSAPKPPPPKVCLSFSGPD